jgi:hypothetical protein
MPKFSFSLGELRIWPPESGSAISKAEKINYYLCVFKIAGLFCASSPHFFQMSLPYFYPRNFKFFTRLTLIVTASKP